MPLMGDDNASKNERFIANSVYGNATAGINVEGGSTEVTVANNISVDNGIDSPRTDSDIRVDASSVVGTSLDYDLVSLAAGETVAIWNSVSYSSLATFKAATAQERHGIEAKPRWRDPAAADFRLTARSPAIDSANSLPPGQPRTDIVRTRRLDNPSTPNTGAGPRRYDDRGAYEFRPHR